MRVVVKSFAKSFSRDSASLHLIHAHPPTPLPVQRQALFLESWCSRAQQNECSQPPSGGPHCLHGNRSKGRM
jgi:hypothetical protein